MSAPCGKLSSRLRRVLSSVLVGVGFASSTSHGNCYAKSNVGYRLGEDGISRKYKYNRDKKLENRRKRVKKRKDSGVCSKILHRIKDNKILTTVEVGSLIGAGIVVKRTFFGSNDVYDVSKSIIKKCLKHGKILGPDEWYDKLVGKDKRVKDVGEYKKLVEESYKKIDEKSSEQIRKDICRSGILDDKGDFVNFLKDMLVCYCAQKKYVYTQGLNFVAALVIIKFTDGCTKTINDQGKVNIYNVFEVIAEIFRENMRDRGDGILDNKFICEKLRKTFDGFVRQNNLRINVNDTLSQTDASIWHGLYCCSCVSSMILSSNREIAFWDYLISTIPEGGKFDASRAFRERFSLHLALVFRACELKLTISEGSFDPITGAYYFIADKNKTEEETEKNLKLYEIT